MKKNKIIGIILIVISIFLVGIFVYTQFFMPEKADKKTIVKTKEKEIAKEKPLVEDEKEQLENTNETGEDLPADFYIDENFKIIGGDKKLDTLTNNNKESLAKAVQEYLYLYGVAGVEQAEIIGYVNMDYDNRVIVTLITGNNKEFKLQALYGIEDKTWNIVTW